jgi:hypothetical protein
VDTRILNPHQQQQKTENGFDIDGQKEKCVDLERHDGQPIDAGPSAGPGSPAYPGHTSQSVKLRAATSAREAVVTTALKNCGHFETKLERHA